MFRQSFQEEKSKNKIVDNNNNNNDQQQKEQQKEQQIQNKNLEQDQSSPFGICRWSNEKKLDKNGSNCPEYLFFSIFKEMLK